MTNTTHLHFREDNFVVDKYKEEEDGHYRFATIRTITEPDCSLFFSDVETIDNLITSLNELGEGCMVDVDFVKVFK